MTRFSIYLGRFAIFAIYFWFGLLKVVGESPASPMVKNLFDITIGKYLHSVSPEQFIIAFGILEMIIGILFLIPKLDRLSITVLSLHLLTTSLPLLLVGHLIWAKSWVPTLEGQYIIKNLAILALALNVYKK